MIAPKNKQQGSLACGFVFSSMAAMLQVAITSLKQSILVDYFKSFLTLPLTRFKVTSLTWGFLNLKDAYNNQKWTILDSFGNEPGERVAQTPNPTKLDAPKWTLTKQKQKRSR